MSRIWSLMSALIQIGIAILVVLMVASNSCSFSTRTARYCRHQITPVRTLAARSVWDVVGTSDTLINRQVVGVLNLWRLLNLGFDSLPCWITRDATITSKSVRACHCQPQQGVKTARFCSLRLHNLTISKTRGFPISGSFLVWAHCKEKRQHPSRPNGLRLSDTIALAASGCRILDQPSAHRSHYAP